MKTDSVLVIVENLPVPLDRRVWLEAKALKEEGYEVSVICPKANGFNKSREIIDGINIYRHYLPEEVSSVLGYFREYFIAICMQIYLSFVVKFQKGIDIIQICNPPDLLFIPAGIHKLLFRSKIIYDLHDSNPDMYAEKFQRKDLLYTILGWLETLTINLAQKVITVNESYKEMVLERGTKKAEDVFVVRSSPDINEYINKKSSQNGRLKVGYVGIIGETDGVENIVEVADYLINKYEQKVLFQIVGDGPVLSSVKEKVILNGLSDFFEFTGMITDKSELIETVSDFTIGIVPDPKTPYSDKCTMNKILEYMALNIPFVYFDLKESMRVAKDAGICIEAGETDKMAKAIIKLINDPEKRTEIGNKGRRLMEDIYNWDLQKEVLLNAYKKVQQSVS